MPRRLRVPKHRRALSPAVLEALTTGELGPRGSDDEFVAFLALGSVLRIDLEGESVVLNNYREALPPTAWALREEVKRRRDYESRRGH